MPVAVAGLVVAVAWPLKAWLDRRLPSTLSYCATISTLLAVLLAFIGAVYIVIAQAVGAFAQNADPFTSTYRSMANWAEERGVSLGAQEGYTCLLQFGQEFLANSNTLLGYLGLVILLVMLALPEVPAFRAKLDELLAPAQRQQLGRALDDIAGKVRQYIGVTTATSLLTGMASTVWALLVGLDLALVWGVLNFLQLHSSAWQPDRHSAANAVRHPAVPSLDHAGHRLHRFCRDPDPDQQLHLWSGALPAH
jgi:AI-2 transport protein TqsA